MSLPDWRTFNGGTKSRVALWLCEEIGAGGQFTKAQLREAFPNVEQVDRRMRDLRPEGWVIHTNSQDVSLNADELRLVSIGGRVWEKSYRPASTSTITDAERRAVLQRDNFACVYCGISAGEVYMDAPGRTATLTVGRTTAASTEHTICTVCVRCRGTSTASSASEVLRQLQGLDALELDTFRAWAEKNVRIQTPLDRVWLAFLRLPAEQRNQVIDNVMHQ